EDLQRALDEADRAVGVVAGAATAYLGRPALELLALATVGDALGQRAKRIGDRAEAIDARAALTGRLRGEVCDHPRALVQSAGALAERDQHARTQRASDRAQVLARQPQRQRPWRVHPGAEVAADEQRL